MPLEFMKSGDKLGVRELVKREVDDAPDYHDGQIESLKRQVSKLADMLGCAVSLMTHDQQRAFVESQTYGWEEVK